MKRIKNILLVLIVFFTFQHCQQKPEEFLVFDLDASHPPREVRLSDLATDLRLVFLETTDESLLPDYFNYYVGEHNILTFSRENILQFDSDGRFIRTLALRGKGPGEFNYVASYTVDTAEEKLYLSHHGGDELLVFNLASGSLEKPITVPEKAQDMIFVNDSMIMALCYGHFDYQSYFINVFSNKIENAKKIEKEEDKKASGSRINYLSLVNNNVYCLFSKSDTLYRYEQKDFMPDLLFKFNNRVDYGKSNTGRDLMFPVHTNRYMLFSTQDVMIEMSESSMSINSGQNPRLFYYDKEENELFDIASFENDFIREPVEHLFLVRKNRDILHIKYSALDFLETMEENLEKDPALQGYYDELLEGFELKEEDNPVIVVGRVI
ncbi:MAG: 6-bladed beta-propeller [Cyclobacteriaceae bacterium]